MAVEYIQETFLRGLAELKENRWQEAGNAFRAAFKASPENPLYLSYYGLIVALAEGSLQDGIVFCKAAIQRAPYEVDPYLNLARIYQKSQQRQKALESLVQGLSYAPGNPALKNEMRRMGMRRKPFFQALSRDNFLNMAVGKLTYQWQKGELPGKTSHRGH
jgi:tetratricopeptide (TPR) repeat protein